ncbi:MAG: hypothetical protein DKINENOH_03968 [bacterium]|nr:hypothetical protein [bacterium]
MAHEKETMEHKSVEQMVEDAKGTLQVLQEGISKTSREIWLAGLGVFSTIDKEGTMLFNRFVERGREMVEKNGKTMKTNGEPAPTYVSEKVEQFTHDVFARLDDAAEFVRKKVIGPAERPAEAARDEVKILSEKVDKLTESVAALVQRLEEATKTGPKAKAM